MTDILSMTAVELGKKIAAYPHPLSEEHLSI